jgi:hypothetical protein
VKTVTVFLFAGVAVLTGCATPFRAPPDVAQIKLHRESSPTVLVEKIWLERESGPLMVKGEVVKRLNAKDTTNTHLDVTLFDGAGAVLRSTVEHFEPRKLEKRWRRPGYGAYDVKLDPLPANTASIEVRAHDGNHT